MALPRPILPAPGRQGDDRPPPTFTPPPKRQQTAVACEQCRKRKIKCDGGRPSCVNCSRKSVTCEYAADPGVGRAGRSVQRQEALERDKETLQTQVMQWQEVIGYVRNRPESEAFSIFQHLRQSRDNDPGEVLRMVQTGEVLAQLQQTSNNSATRPQFEQFEQAAWLASEIQVEAEPWTSVVGDGILSELISLYFRWDAAFHCPMVDTAAFLNDLRSKNTQSRFCSSMLVNAMCSLSCFVCDRIQEKGTEQRNALAKRFFEAAEAEADKNSKPSLASVQALYIMFMYSIATGQDKKYAKYRFTACSMIHSLNLDKKYAVTVDGSLETQVEEHVRASTNPAFKELKNRVISRAIWGLFCTESVVALAYGQPSLIAPPKIPQPEQDFIMKVQCDLSLVTKEIMEHTRQNVLTVGDSHDVESRNALYVKLRSCMESISTEEGQNFDHTTELHHLSEFFHLLAVILLRPLLACDDEVELAGQGSARTLCINHCAAIVEPWTRDDSSKKRRTSSLWQVMTPATCCFTLLPQLGRLSDPRIPGLFVACCAMLRRETFRWPLAVYWLQALHVFARTINTTEFIPREALQYLDGLDGLGVDIKGDVPIGFIVPMSEELIELASDSDAPEVSIGKLIEKFNASNLEL